jgi:hypothetical protein
VAGVVSEVGWRRSRKTASPTKWVYGIDKHSDPLNCQRQNDWKKARGVGIVDFGIAWAKTAPEKCPFWIKTYSLEGSSGVFSGTVQNPA